MSSNSGPATCASVTGEKMYFEATKSILSLPLEAIAKSRKIKRAQALKQATKHLSVMTEQWFAGEVPQIAYDDPLCRWAYVYAHVPAHANLFENVLQICAQGRAGFRKMLTGEELSVLVFGGGPRWKSLAFFAKAGPSYPKMRDLGATHRLR